VLDVISPCVTFNNHEGSTKSYKYAKEMETPIHELGYIPFFEQITVDYEPGTIQDVELHDGSHLRLKKLEKGYDPTDRMTAITTIQNASTDHQFLTGLLYIDESKSSFADQQNLPDTALALLKEDKLRPPKEALDKIMAELM
jgi:2-oxoglutarate ferredoxin oxidoreductase subunit beta